MSAATVRDLTEEELALVSGGGLFDSFDWDEVWFWGAVGIGAGLLIGGGIIGVGFAAALAEGAVVAVDAGAIASTLGATGLAGGVLGGLYGGTLALQLRIL